MFITLEGIDGCGKTTQLRLLAERLRSHGRQVVETAEPGGTPIGTQIRSVLLDPANDGLFPTTELLLYFASRAQNVGQSIRPALSEGRIVLCDRFTDSTLAYQGCGRGLGTETVLALDRIACQGLTPDLTLLIDIDLETSLARAQARNRRIHASGGHAETRMDEQSLDFYRAVRAAYHELAASNPARIRTVDGEAKISVIASKIWDIVVPYV